MVLVKIAEEKKDIWLCFFFIFFSFGIISLILLANQREVWSLMTNEKEPGRVLHTYFFLNTRPGVSVEICRFYS